MENDNEQKSEEIKKGESEPLISFKSSSSADTKEPYEK